VAVQASEARLRQQIARMPIACITLSRELIVLSWNPAAERIFGYSEAEIVGRSFMPLVPNGASKSLGEVWAQLLDGEGGEHHINENIAKDGRTVVCRWTNTPLFDEQGTVTSVLSMAEDITEGVQAQCDLLESESRYRQLLDQLPHFVFSVDSEDRYMAVNAAACRFFERPDSEIVGRTAQELGADPESVQVWTAQNARTRETGDTQIADSEAVVDGKLCSFRAITSPLRDLSGDIIGVSGVSIDMTAMKAAEAATHRANERLNHLSRMESLGTLAGGIAHDFNNILAIILTHTALVERRHSDPVLLARALDTIRQAVQRGTILARQVLTFASRAEIKLQNVDVVQLIAGVRAMIAESLPENVTLTVDAEPDLPVISADEGQLHRSLLNLCINARDAMHDGGALRIEARRRSAAAMQEEFPDARNTDYVVISVSDTGVGMDEETRRHIFEPFFSTKSRGKGTGLGLALVFGVANNHGGLVDVDSYLGAGTTFRLFLPLEAVAAPVAAAT
jgi:two-component system cell cycle sensor histidine kinase/response regulator CckA